jgi:predicted GIY-YIG superfamily endonuclease
MSDTTPAEITYKMKVWGAQELWPGTSSPGAAVTRRFTQTGIFRNTWVSTVYSSVPGDIVLPKSPSAGVEPLLACAAMEWLHANDVPASRMGQDNRFFPLVVSMFWGEFDYLGLKTKDEITKPEHLWIEKYVNQRIPLKDEHVVYRAIGERAVLLYVGVTKDFPNRMKAHSKSSDWWDVLSRIHIERFDSRQDALTAEATAIRAEDPIYNIAGRDDG